jgi:hypothetical protein
MSKAGDRFHEELSYVRASVVAAIRARDEAVVREGLDLYKALVQVFARRLKQFGAQYDHKSAQAEGSSLFGHGWPEIEWIERDYWAFLTEAFEAPHPSILREILFFPTAIAHISLQEGDYLTFHKLTVRTPGMAYKLAAELPDERMRAMGTRLVSRYMTEFARYSVAIRLDRAERAGEIIEVGEIARGVLVIFNELLRLAFDSRRIDDFVKFGMEMSKLFENYESQVDGFEDWRAEQQEKLGLQAFSPGQEEVFGALDRLLSELETLKRVIRLGIGAWICREYQMGTLTSTEFHRWFGAAAMEGSLKSLTWTFWKARSREYETLLRWDWWVMEGREEGVLHWGGYEMHLDTAYVVRALEIVSESEIATARAEEAVVDRDFVHYLDGDEASLKQTLRSTASPESKWRSVMGHDVDERVRLLSTYFTILVQQTKQQLAARVVESDLDAERVEIVARDILKGFEKQSEIRAFFEQAGAYGAGGAAPGDVEGYGFNRLLPKDMFVAGSNVSIEGWGEQIGADLAWTVGTKVLEGIEEATLHRLEARVDRSVAETVLETVSALRARKFDPTILLVGGWKAYEAITSDSRFVQGERGWGPRRGRKLGALNGAPVYSIPRSASARAFVAEFGRLGRWEQYEAKADEAGAKVLGQFLFFSLMPVTEEMAGRAVRERPAEFLKGVAEPTPAQIAAKVFELRQQVQLRLFAWFRFDLREPEAGECLLLPND